jgi:hypothetical protein
MPQAEIAHRQIAPPPAGVHHGQSRSISLAMILVFMSVLVAALLALPDGDGGQHDRRPGDISDLIRILIWMVAVLPWPCG